MMRTTRRQKYRVPQALVRYLCGFDKTLVIRRVMETLVEMDIEADGFVRFQNKEGEMEESKAEHLVALGQEIVDIGLERTLFEALWSRIHQWRWRGWKNYGCNSQRSSKL